MMVLSIFYFMIYYLCEIHNIPNSTILSVHVWTKAFYSHLFLLFNESVLKMIKMIVVDRSRLFDVLETCSVDLKEPIYRSLYGKSLDTYVQTGFMYPQCGALEAGTGVFFSLDSRYVKDMNLSCIVIADLADFRLDNSVIDTRNTSYLPEFRQRTIERKSFSHSGYDIWDEVCRLDTLVEQHGGYIIYTHRKSIHRDQLKYEVWID